MKTKPLLPKQLALLIMVLLFSKITKAQEVVPAPTAPIPEIKGYFGIVNPIYTFQKNENAVNFKNYYTFGMPCGINMWKSKKFGLSFEFTPFIKATNTTSSVSYVLLHPGALYRVRKNTLLCLRAAYQTNGRYGFTPIITQILIRQKEWNLFGSVLLAARYGNSEAASYTASVMFGIGF